MNTGLLIRIITQSRLSWLRVGSTVLPHALLASYVGPNWSFLRGSGEAAQVARAALATELDGQAGDLGVGVARTVLGEEPKRDVRPWVCDGNRHIQESPHPRAPKSAKSLKKVFPGLPARSLGPEKESKRSQNQCSETFLTLF